MTNSEGFAANVNFRFLGTDTRRGAHASIRKREGQTLGDLEEGHVQAASVSLLHSKILYCAPRWIDGVLRQSIVEAMNAGLSCVHRRARRAFHWI
jgi:hypothetical protein